jgi:RimJ/RimL family protein N-acetyltransferase
VAEFLYKSGSGIRFRRVEAADVPDLIDLKSESWFGTHRVSFVSQASQERWLSALDAEDIHSPRNLVLAAVAGDPEEDVPAPIPRQKHPGLHNVGVFKVLDIDWQSRRASVGWDVYRPYRGEGTGRSLVEAGVAFCFNVLCLHRLQADVLATNRASQKCAEAAGFTKDGLQAKAILRGGKWIDNIIYGIVAPDPE